MFQLARDDGTPTGKVIKINHGDLGSKMLNNNVVRPAIPAICLCLLVVVVVGQGAEKPLLRGEGS